MPSTIGIVSSGHLPKPAWLGTPSFTYGVEASQTISITSAPVATVSFVSGALPSDIGWSYGNNVFTLSGTPTSKTAYTATFRATNGAGSTDLVLSGTPTVNKISATGGTVTDYNGYRIHEFTSLSSFVITSGVDDIEIVLLGGGGGGAGDGNGAGGAGAGGKVQTILTRRSSGTYPVVIGGGGAAGGNYQEGINGANSTAFSLTALGGGGGGDYATGLSGGCGGGAGFGGYRGTGSQGGNGGAYGFYNGGGGGGIGEPGFGENGNGFNGPAAPNETGGYAGQGTAVPGNYNPTTGEIVLWKSGPQVLRGGGGGGGGGANGYSNASYFGGGYGVGGAHESLTGSYAQPGVVNTGGGGGSGYSRGAAGGSGYVALRYLL